ncbi:uncharacterized protein LOC117233944 [Bombus vosnesenskii]|uniref:Uncharacterized protein LOC117233944 n=1 Tax=Bombus vosnesenskii TaxID=207650 RepID=A0A6J3KCR8_9HYME|nr:uncharacterized protein LOC117233944 [Bombus vosnesenskii]
MTIRSAGQFASNMLRCTIFVVQLFGLLATCCCTLLYRNTYNEVPTPINCSQGKNSTECITRTMQHTEHRRNEISDRKSRMIEKEELGNANSGVEQVTGRRKKNRGYGQMLLYFLGASKLTMLYVLINAVAAIAGKALIVGKVALVIAAAVALKKAFEHKEKVSYEIIKHPYHSYEHSFSTDVDDDHQGGFGEYGYNYRKRRRIFY